MKKSNYLWLFSLLFFALVGCSKDMNPMTDTTELWPAYSESMGKWGYINKKGEMKIQAIYDEASTYSCGLALVRSGQNVFFIDKKGNVKSGMSFDNAELFYNDYAVFSLSGKEGLLNKKMEYAIQPIYESLGDMHGGLCSASLKGEQYGFVNKSGKTVIPEIYDEVGDYMDGLAPVYNGSKWGCINDKNKFIVEPIYEGIGSFYSKMAPFEKGEKYGFLSTSGEEVVPPIYDDYEYYFENDLAPVCSNGNWGYIDKKGNVAIALQYSDAKSFVGGMALVAQESQDGLVVWSVIDTKGKTLYVLPTGYRPLIDYFHNGLLLVLNVDENTSEVYCRYMTVKGETVYMWKAVGIGTNDAPQKATSKQGMKAIPTIHYTLGK